MEEIKCITILRSGYLLKKVRSSPEKKGDQPTFFFQYGQNYNPEKKYAVPLRTIIGKAHPSDNTLMYPNEKYQEYFPDAVLPEELPEAYRSCCLRIGAYAIICYVLNEYKLSQLLARWFPKDNGLLMDLVAYLIVNEDNDFLLPSLIINKNGMQTLPLRTYLFFGQFTKKWDLATAALVLCMIPIVIFYLSCQKHIVKGITAGVGK